LGYQSKAKDEANQKNQNQKKKHRRENIHTWAFVDGFPKALSDFSLHNLTNKSKKRKIIQHENLHINKTIKDRHTLTHNTDRLESEGIERNKQ